MFPDKMAVQGLDAQRLDGLSDDLIIRNFQSLSLSL
jgi:hypothetical protein